MINASINLNPSSNFEHFFILQVSKISRSLLDKKIWENTYDLILYNSQKMKKVLVKIVCSNVETIHTIQHNAQFIFLLTGWVKTLN